VLRSSSFSLRLFRTSSLAFALAVVSVCLTQPARAEVSSWASVMSGPIWLDEGSEGFRLSQGFKAEPALTMQAGMGSTPNAPFVLGGLLQLQTLFDNGTDMGLLARGATRGFVLGDWGAALDVGGYLRLWGIQSEGALASVSLGAPWGVTLSAMGGLGTRDARQFGVQLGVDLARLTVYRSTGLKWFPNPYPGYQASK
jgi:hypothetical protein